MFTNVTFLVYKSNNPDHNPTKEFTNVSFFLEALLDNRRLSPLYISPCPQRGEGEYIYNGVRKKKRYICKLLFFLIFIFLLNPPGLLWQKKTTWNIYLLLVARLLNSLYHKARWSLFWVFKAWREFPFFHQ